ncbi:UNVERIFIED_CONTAM: hypothetical protein Scaly_1197900 [Sesamum calycinum]|uniref:Uncharacterized protein n=1 Tax=Sesamum calycinum TaxID=2727403 RepID=A0AAW2Q3V7_9LAMI
MLVINQQANRHIPDLAETFGILRKYHMKQYPYKCAFGVKSDHFLGFIVTTKGIDVNAQQDMNHPRYVRYLNQVQREIRHIATLRRSISRVVYCSLPFFKILRQQIVSSVLIKKDDVTGKLIYYVSERKLETSGIMIKWVVELSEYDISYKSRMTIKAQQVGEFMIEVILAENNE